MRNCYEINSETLAVIPLKDQCSRVIETTGTFLVESSVKQIIDHSCRYFGSSYQGRFEGTKGMMGISYKSPIIVEETRNMIFFPTTSPRIDECIWISLSHILTYTPKASVSNVQFKNGQTLDLSLSYQSLDNQVLRASRLLTLLQQRKLEK